MKLTPEQIAKRALDCRTIRLWIAAFPGRTSFEVYKGTGIRNAQTRLFKMLGMGIVKMEQAKEEDGRKPQRWFVVPQ